MKSSYFSIVFTKVQSRFSEASLGFYPGSLYVYLPPLYSVKEWLLQVVVAAENEIQNDTEELAYVLNARASLHKVLGEYDVADQFYIEAETVSRKGGHKAPLAAALNNRGLLLSQTGQVSMYLSSFVKQFLVEFRLPSKMGYCSWVESPRLKLGRIQFFSAHSTISSLSCPSPVCGLRSDYVMQGSLFLTSILS
jgi:hypothetical protein